VDMAVHICRDIVWSALEAGGLKEDFSPWKSSSDNICSYDCIASTLSQVDIDETHLTVDETYLTVQWFDAVSWPTEWLPACSISSQKFTFGYQLND